MTVAATVDASGIPALVERFASEPYPGTGVLSVFLDTSPARVPEKEYLISLRDVVRRLRLSIPADQLAAFDAAASSAEAVAAGATPGRTALAIYAGDNPAVNTSVQLPLPAYDVAVWGPEPDIEPLREAADERQRVVVALFDSSQVRLLTIHLGRIEEHAEAEGDVPPRHDQGGWYALSQKKWARRRQNEFQRHARNAVGMLLQELDKRPFERLFLGGPADAVVLLRNQLPDVLARRLSGVVKLEMFASPTQILEATLHEAEAAERRDEIEQVDRLLNSRTATNVIIGLDPVLQALMEERVNRILVTDFRGVAGFECPNCGRIVGGGGACPVCSTELEPLPSLRSAVVERALAQGARVDFLHGDAAVRLNEFGVVAAWTWY